MRAFLLITLLFAAWPARASVTNTEVTVTFTNVVAGVTNGDTLTFNGSVRRYTNGVLNDATLWIQSTNNVGHAATNTAIHFNTYGTGLGISYISFANAANVHLTNAIRVVGALGADITITLSSGVGIVTYTTNVFDSYRPVSYPSGSLPTAAARTNNQSGLVGLLGDSFATNVVPNSVPSLTNLVDRISYQSLTNKTLYSTTNIGGLANGLMVTNCIGIWGSNGTLWGMTFLGSSNSGFIGALTNGTLYSNVLEWVRGTNLVALHGNVHSLTGGIYTTAILLNPVTTNLVNYGNAIRSEGAGGNSLQVGSNALAVGSLSMAIGNSALATNANSTALGVNSEARTNSTAVGTGARATGLASVAVGDAAAAAVWGATAVGVNAVATGGDFGSAFGAFADASGSGSLAAGAASVASGWSAVAVGGNASASAAFSLSLGDSASAQHSNSAAIGPPDHLGNATATSDTNQIRLGTANHRTDIPGQLLISGTQSNTTFAGTNILRGSWSWPAFNLSTLAAAVNVAVPFGTNCFIRVSAGGAGTIIAGAVGAATSGGNDGQDILLQNASGAALSIVVSTADPVPANRFAGSDVTVANGGFAGIGYDLTSARWRVHWIYPTSATATNAIASVWTNGVVVSSMATNLNIISATAGAFLATNVSGQVNIEFVSTAGSGEDNVTGEISLTNNAAGIFGLTYGKAGITNLLRSVSAGANMVITNQGTNLVFASTASGGGGGAGSLPMNAFQFNTNGIATIKDSAVMTNVSLYALTGIEQLVVDSNLVMNSITPDRVAIWDSSSYLTNSAAVDTTELEYLDGVTGGIQTNIDARATTASVQSATNDAYAYTRSLTNQPVLVSSNITQSATNDAYAYARGVTNGLMAATVASTNDAYAYARGVTNNSILRTNTVTAAGAGIVIRQDGAGGITVSNTLSAAAGEANVNGEISLTNATTFGLVYGKADVTNLLRSVSAGANMVITNQGTNLIFASTASGSGGGSEIIWINTSAAAQTYGLNTLTNNVLLVKTNANFDLTVTNTVSTNIIAGDGIWVEGRLSGTTWIMRW